MALVNAPGTQAVHSQGEEAMTIAVLAALVFAGLAIRPALAHDAELPVSVRGRK